MQYAATINLLNREEVAVVLPLKAVPAFDPDNPPPNAYLVPEEVQQGWIKQDDGKFCAPPESNPPESEPKPEPDESETTIE